MIIPYLGMIIPYTGMPALLFPINPSLERT